jgi:hypothetical protein
MNSLYHAYQAFERRAERGEFSPEPRKKASHQPSPKRLEIWLGEILINTGLKLKRHAVAGKSMAWSPLTGSKQ